MSSKYAPKSRNIKYYKKYKTQRYCQKCGKECQIKDMKEKMLFDNSKILLCKDCFNSFKEGGSYN